MSGVGNSVNFIWWSLPSKLNPNAYLIYTYLLSHCQFVLIFGLDWNAAQPELRRFPRAGTAPGTGRQHKIEVQLLRDPPVPSSGKNFTIPRKWRPSEVILNVWAVKIDSFSSRHTCFSYYFKIKEMGKILDTQTKELEGNHIGASTNSLSSPSEEISIRSDYYT